MKNIFKKISHSINGTAAVELALIFPVMLLLVVGALDYGSAFVRKIELTEVTKAGIQYAMVKQPTYSDYVSADYTSISDIINDNLGTSGNDSTTVLVSYKCQCDGVEYVCTSTCAGSDNTFINVKISENYETPFFNYSWLGVNFPISTDATIRLK